MLHCFLPGQIQLILVLFIEGQSKDRGCFVTIFLEQMQKYVYTARGRYNQITIQVVLPSSIFLDEPNQITPNLIARAHHRVFNKGNLDTDYFTLRNWDKILQAPVHLHLEAPKELGTQLWPVIMRTWNRMAALLLLLILPIVHGVEVSFHRFSNTRALS